MRHAILGPGGVGGLIAGTLARAGEEVILIVRPESVPTHPETLHIESQVAGTFDAPVACTGRLQRPVDALWVTVKATALPDALESAPPSLLAGALVIPLLNGFDHVPLLRERYGKERVVPATFRGETERTAPGVIRQPSPFVIVELVALPPNKARIAQLADLLNQTGIECRTTDNESHALWSKLALLAPTALGTSAAGGSTGAVRADPTLRALMEGCIRETCAVANACGAELDAAEVFAFIEDRVPDSMRTSMQKDIEAGRQPELQAIAGPILREGASHGIACPATRELAERVSRKSGLPLAL